MCSRIELLICWILYPLLGNVLILFLVAFSFLVGFFCFFVKSIYFADFLLRRIELGFQKV